MQPNLVFVFADQMRRDVLSCYGESPIETPNLDRLAREGVQLDQCVSTCPVCTPYRAMLLTGRHPQSTGMVINSLRTRYDELGVGDAFAAAGYRTAWVGKWHLHTGAWPGNNVPDWVPRGRSRLGFEHWRGYNQHMVYFDGHVHSPRRDFDVERWDGYETEGLLRYATAFMEGCAEDPFALFLSPQPPHVGMGPPEDRHMMAPDRCYEGLPDGAEYGEEAWVYRNYLAMCRAVDEMMGQLLAYLDRTGRSESTLVVFTSDHGTQARENGLGFWDKKSPYGASMDVPCLLRFPGVLPAGGRCDALSAPVDLFPSLCGLCGVPVPASVEGMDLSAAWRGEPEARRQEALFCMNFGNGTDYFVDGREWRGVRTRRWQYTVWLDGTVELYDLHREPDPYDLNLASDPAHAEIRGDLDARLRGFQAERGDVLQPGSAYEAWVDEQRRIVRNGYGPLSHPERVPDYRQLRPH